MSGAGVTKISLTPSDCAVYMTPVSSRSRSSAWGDESIAHSTRSATRSACGSHGRTLESRKLGHATTVGVCQAATGWTQALRSIGLSLLPRARPASRAGTMQATWSVQKADTTHEP
jgi:hypothetical protein